MLIKVFDISGKYAIAPSSGKEIYAQIHPALQAGEQVELDFSGVEVFASAFFNFSIGQLLRDLQPDTLNSLLKFSNLNSSGSATLRHIIDNAKRYYLDSNHRKAVDEVIGEYASSFGV